MTNNDKMKIKKIREKVEGIIQAERHAPDGCGSSAQSFIFPDSVITGIAGEFTDLYSSYLEVPREFLFMGFITCLGAILCTTLSLDSEISPQPRLYTVFLGRSSDERKSTAILKVTGFFKEFYPDRFDECWGIGSAEGLMRKMKENRGLLLCFDELKHFASKAAIESSIMLPMVNTLFESNRYESQIKKGGIDMRNAYLCILGASTIETYETIWTPQFISIGFNNRLFIVPGSSEKKFPIPQRIPDSEKIKIKNHLDRILRNAAGQTRLKLTKKAQELYNEWYLMPKNSVLSKRIDTYALRLMPLFAVNEGKREISEDIVRKVIDLCDWQLQVRQLHDPVDADNTIAKMEEKIRRLVSAHGQISTRTLRQKSNANRTGLWIFNTAMENLKRAGDIRLYDSKAQTWTGGL